MLGSPLDIAQGIALVVNNLITLHKLDRWARLVFTMAFSGVVSCLTIAGGALTAHRSQGEAMGAGMISAAVMMTALFRRSDLTKGMTVALPEEEAKAEISADQQTISK